MKCLCHLRHNMQCFLLLWIFWSNNYVLFFPLSCLILDIFLMCCFAPSLLRIDVFSDVFTKKDCNLIVLTKYVSHSLYYLHFNPLTWVKNVSDEEKLNSQFSSCIICVYTFCFFVSYIEIILKKNIWRCVEHTGVRDGVFPTKIGH